MTEELEQLLKNLRLRRSLQILDQELEWAEKKGPSYTDFLTRLLRHEYHDQQDRFLEYRIRRAKLPERWSLESFPWKRQPGVKKAQIEQLAELDFISQCANIVFVAHRPTDMMHLLARWLETKEVHSPPPQFADTDGLLGPLRQPTGLLEASLPPSR